jgi:putative membrane protein
MYLIFAAIAALIENLTNFERVRRTPIPMAYSIHLHHCVWVYLLAVPFQFVETHSWGTILIMGLASFCMLGILSIAYEIEDPFGYDDNDLVRLIIYSILI